MASLKELEKERDRAFNKFQEMKKKLSDPETLPFIGLAAQEANDAWLEFKKMETAFTNQLVMKQMGELYGC